jgi:hypothetical protein
MTKLTIETAPIFEPLLKPSRYPVLTAEVPRRSPDRDWELGGTSSLRDTLYGGTVREPSAAAYQTTAEMRRSPTV